MIGLHFPLGFAKFGRGAEGFAPGLPVHLAGQPDVRAVPRLSGLMAMTVGFSATPLNRGDGTTAEIPETHQVFQQRRPLLFENGQGIWQEAPPILTYHYVRIGATKKGTPNTPLPCRTPP